MEKNVNFDQEVIEKPEMEKKFFGLITKKGLKKVGIAVVTALAFVGIAYAVKKVKADKAATGETAEVEVEQPQVQVEERITPRDKNHGRFGGNTPRRDWNNNQQ